MHVLFIFLIFTITEANRHSHNIPLPTNNAPSEAFGQGVDFGHVYRKGFRDSNFKQQFDLDNDMVLPNYDGNVKELLQDSYKDMRLEPKDDALIFLSPRDEVLYNKKYNKTSLQSEDNKKSASNRHLKEISRPTWYDFSKLLERNLAYPFANRRRKVFETKEDRKFNQTDRNVHVNVSNYFESNTFYKKINNRKLNWTTCNEFAKKAVFHPDDIVNTKWLPFYIWSTRGFTSAVIHTFSYPTKKIVQNFKNSYAPYMKTLNWNEPKLLLKERRHILLIAGDRKGLFHGIPRQELASYLEGKNITLPTITLRMKIHDPYLAMMFCDENYAVLMAELGTEPKSERDKILEASTLKFKGIGKPAHRDLEAEVLLVELEKKKKIEAESRKIIHIERPSGDVDLKVKH